MLWKPNHKGSRSAVAQQTVTQIEQIADTQVAETRAAPWYRSQHIAHGSLCRMEEIAHADVDIGNVSAECRKASIDAVRPCIHVKLDERPVMRIARIAGRRRITGRRRISGRGRISARWRGISAGRRRISGTGTRAAPIAA
jgi:hypothetical protein